VPRALTCACLSVLTMLAAARPASAQLTVNLDASPRTIEFDLAVDETPAGYHLLIFHTGEEAISPPIQTVELTTATSVDGRHVTIDIEDAVRALPPREYLFVLAVIDSRGERLQLAASAPFVLGASSAAELPSASPQAQSPPSSAAGDEHYGRLGTFIAIVVGAVLALPYLFR
jgi:hypothetical protein